MSHQRPNSNPWVELWRTTVSGVVKTTFIVSTAGLLFAGLAYSNGGAEFSFGELSLSLPARAAAPVPMALPAVPPAPPAPPELPPAPAVVPVARNVIPFLGIWYHGDVRLVPGSDGFSEVYGAHVRAIIPDSPAQAVGIQEGDLITAVDGQPLSEVEDLRNAVLGSGIGTIITLDGFRDDRPVTFRATLGERTAVER